jgi:hypothetical protein
MDLSTPYLRNLFLLYLNVRNAYEREEAACTQLEDGAHRGYEKIVQILFDRGARKGISLFLAVAQGHKIYSQSWSRHRVKKRSWTHSLGMCNR